MRICFNQPAFIPWGGFFARLLFSDRMVLLDETILARGFTYVNRNRIKGPCGEVWLTVPLKKKGRGRQKIKDLEIHEKNKWAKKYLSTLRHDYGKSVYFEPIFKEMRAVSETPDENFLYLIFGLIDVIKNALEIGQKIILQSELGITGRGTSLLVSAAKELGAREVILPYYADKAIDCSQFKKEKIRVRLLKYSPPQYPQFWGEFLINLSALDLLLCCGKNGKAVIEKGSFLYELQ